MIRLLYFFALKWIILNKVIQNWHSTRLKPADSFEIGFLKMFEVLEPQKIIFYGTANCPGVDKARKQQIEIIHFRSERDLAFRGKRNV